MNPLLTPHLFQEELYHVPEKTIVVLKRSWEDYNADERALLEKILSSVKLSVNAVQVITNPAFSMDLPGDPRNRHVLIFGSEAKDIVPYEVTTAQGFSIIRADDLPELDDARKKSLWLALKAMFGV